MRSLAIAIPILFLLAGARARPQDAKKEYDFTWKLPHDRAAIYDVFDSSKKKVGEFTILGCEVGGQFAVTQGRELGYRYVFRMPKDKVKVGSKWEMQERVFNANAGWAISPLEVRGMYSLRQVKKARLDEVFKWLPKGEKFEPTELAVVEGQFEVFRCRLTDKKTAVPEKNSSAMLMTTAVWRLSDGVIVGGRFQWQGRLDRFQCLTDGKFAQTEEGAELLLKEPLLELTAASLKARIDRAIAQGVKWLKGKQQEGGKWCDQRVYPIGTAQAAGSSALVVEAIVHCGVGPEDPAVKNGYTFIAAANSPQSYDISLHLMALEAKYLPLETLEDVKSFSEAKAREAMAKKVTKQDKALAEALARRLMDLQGSNGGFGYTDNKGGTIVLSNTQYSLLGLKSASRLGVAIPTSVWKKALRYIESASVFTDAGINWEVVHYDGTKVERKSDAYGWLYQIGCPPEDSLGNQLTGTMTTAALTGMGICRSELSRSGEWSDDLVKKVDKLESGGIAWLQKNYSVRAATPEGAWNLAAMPYFYLYSLERASIITGIEKIGGHDWYLEGAAILLSWQKLDGSWEGPHETPVVDTAFALLFLKRAIVPVATPSNASDGKK